MSELTGIIIGAFLVLLAVVIICGSFILFKHLTDIVSDPDIDPEKAALIGLVWIPLGLWCLFLTITFVGLFIFLVIDALTDVRDCWNKGRRL